MSILSTLKNDIRAVQHWQPVFVASEQTETYPSCQVSITHPLKCYFLVIAHVVTLSVDMNRVSYIYKYMSVSRMRETQQRICTSCYLVKIHFFNNKLKVESSRCQTFYVRQCLQMSLLCFLEHTCLHNCKVICSPEILTKNYTC